MARHYVLPDPDDRSINAPSVIVSSQQVIGIYNQENPTDKMEKVTQKVQEWFTKHSKDEGKWDSATFAGNQCLLNVSLTRTKK